MKWHYINAGGQRFIVIDLQTGLIVGLTQLAHKQLFRGNCQALRVPKYFSNKAVFFWLNVTALGLIYRSLIGDVKS